MREQQKHSKKEVSLPVSRSNAQVAHAVSGTQGDALSRQMAVSYNNQMTWPIFFHYHIHKGLQSWSYIRENLPVPRSALDYYTLIKSEYLFLLLHLAEIGPLFKKLLLRRRMRGESVLLLHN